MKLNIGSAIECTWIVLILVWLTGLIFRKRTARSQPLGGRLLHLSIAVLGFAAWRLRLGWLAERFIPDVDAVQIAALALTVAGCLFAIWARATLGSNWSGAATVKVDHELVIKGPYALARHPIYTGLLLAAIGGVLAGGEWRCIVGFVIVLSALLVKISQEERLMVETFPDEYPRYRQRVKALIPGVI